MYLRQLALVVISSALLGVAAPCVKSQEAVAQEPARLVESVDIQGNRRIRDEDILYYTKTRPGQSFSRKQAERDLQSILALGFFIQKRRACS